MGETYREDRFHGTQQFPCALYTARGNILKTYFEVKHHWHSEIEIMFLKKGKFYVEINMKKYNVEAPCICIINSGELHALKPLSNEYDESAVVFQPEILNFLEQDNAQKFIISQITKERIKFPDIIDSDNTLWKRVKSEYKAIEEGFKKDNTMLKNNEFIAYTPLTQLIVKTSLLKIICLFEQNSMVNTGQNEESTEVKYIKTVLLYIHENYKEKIYIRDLASQVGLNEQYFCRVFRRVINMSPIEYINHYRLKKAMNLLETTDMSVTDIAYECGYKDMAGFIKGFKKIAETSPLKYRKKLRGR